nr:26S proteasome non-ATPase regulatory subunit 4-like [Rhipicephalus microplus]
MAARTALSSAQKKLFGRSRASRRPPGLRKTNMHSSNPGPVGVASSWSPRKTNAAPSGAIRDVVDTSEYARNGDFAPSRIEAQAEAVEVVCNSTTENPGSEVALMTMVGPEVQVTLTNDVERLQRRLAQLQPKGYINFVAAVHLARVILRNQREKNRKKRIVIFVGSPVCTTPEELTVLATLLKTEKVHVDIVNFGEYVENYGQLTIFTSILNGDGTSSSCLVTVPAGNILSKVVAGSAIVQGEKSRRDPNFYLDFEDDDPAWLLVYNKLMNVLKYLKIQLACTV